MCYTSEEHERSTPDVTKRIRQCLKLKRYITYSDKVTHQYINITPSYPPIQVHLQFPEKLINVYDEVLIFDEISLLSSLGGALGLFVGFSFFGFITTILDAVLDKGAIGFFKRYLIYCLVLKFAILYM